ncbi:MAG: hypothetical protein ACHQZQ_03055 [SAR324 cluster bacterium]
MQIARKFVMGGRPLVPRTLQARLALSAVGTATLQIGPEALTPGPADARAIEGMLGSAKGQLAECFVSVAGQQDYLVLMGPVVQVRAAGGVFDLTVRELCTVLDIPTSIYSRQCSAREIVASVEKKSGLHFLVPARAPFLDEIKPVFQFAGTCRAALEKVIQAWDLPEVVWYQLPDGTMFFGPWRTGPFTKSDVPVDERLVLEKNVEQRTLRLPMIPALRPGMIVNCGFRFRIDELQFEHDTVSIRWSRL